MNFLVLIKMWLAMEWKQTFLVYMTTNKILYRKDQQI